MITYYTEQEFIKVVIDTLATEIVNQKANIEKEMTTVYFTGSPDTEYAIRGKAILKTSFNTNGYFIVQPKK